METTTPTTPDAGVPRRRADDILSMLADKVGAQFTASSIFGSPVERDGITVVPVAAVRFGFGGGGGGDASAEQEGDGGGAAGTGGPVGYIELKDGGSRFVPIVRPARMLALVCTTALAALLIARAGRDRG